MRAGCRRVIAVVSLLLVGACAGRAPAPVAVIQPADETMQCAALQAEVATNTRRLSELGVETGQKAAQNVVAGLTGILIVPLFLMDFQFASVIDERALQSRNVHLAALAVSRCPLAPLVTEAPGAGWTVSARLTDL